MAVTCPDGSAQIPWSHLSNTRLVRSDRGWDVGANADGDSSPVGSGLAKPARKVVAKGNCSFDVRHTMTFTERSYRDAFGHIVIHSRLGPPTGRQGFEKQFFPSVEVGLPGWQRAHSQGQGTGFESPNAVRYAPAEVNQEFQRLGIERHLRELFQMKAADTELWLTTVTATHKNSLRLKEIQYRIDAVRSGASRRLFEASIEIADQKINPRVVASATPFASL